MKRIRQLFGDEMSEFLEKMSNRGLLNRHGKGFYLSLASTSILITLLSVFSATFQSERVTNDSAISEENAVTSIEQFNDRLVVSTNGPNIQEFAMMMLPGDLPWAGSAINGQTVILQPGIALISCGTTSGVMPDERFTMGLLDISGAIPASGRTEVTGTTDVWHHPDWTVSQIGNIYGVAINKKTGDMFGTASANYGAGYFGQVGVIGYGAIGGGTNDLNAAGTVYRFDAVTGQPTVFAVLPQQSSTFTHLDCETTESATRTTGVGLGNIAYDEDNDQFFVSNSEDGRIYRLDNMGNILDSYDPLTYDDGVPGISSVEQLSYGIVKEPGVDRLFFGSIDSAPGAGAQAGTPAVYSIDLTPSGGFAGTVDNTFLHAGATYDNYVGTEVLHTTIATGGGASFASDYMYFISSMDFSFDGQLVVGIRVGCKGSYFTSYNHWGEISIVDKNNNTNIYNQNITEFDVSFAGDAGPDDGYGGAGYYLLNDGSGEVRYAISSGDILDENGPHGIAVFSTNSIGTPVSPLGAISYGTVDNLGNGDPKGVGGDVVVYSGCVIDYASINVSDCSSGTYSVTGELVYTGAPNPIGMITVTIDDDGGTQSVQIDPTVTTSFSFTGLSCNGTNGVNVTAAFDNNISCTITDQINEPNESCSLNISEVSIGECLNNDDTGNQPQVLVAVFVDWSAAPAGDIIEVTFAGQTLTIDPSDAGCPNYVQFLVAADGSSGTATAGFTTDGACSDSEPYTLPMPCMQTPVCDGVNTIGGNVFSDFDASGTIGASEFGKEGVGVKVFDCDGNEICSTTTDLNGNWTCEGLTNGDQVRVEFFNFGQNCFEGGIGADNEGGSVQFTTVGDCDVDFGVTNPEDFCDNSPLLVVPCYLNGDPTIAGSGAANGDVLVAVPYNSSGESLDNIYLAFGSEVGSTWGIAYQKESKQLFSSAFLKRHTGLTNHGLGAIFSTDMSTIPPTVPGASSLFVNLDNLGINTGDESSLTRDLVGDPAIQSHDSDVFDLVGKWGLGDLDMSDDGSTLYVVNLFNKTLVEMTIGVPAVSPGAATEIAIPNPGCSNADDWRPFGLKYHKGKLYVGGVCSAQTSQSAADLQATIYEYDPTLGTFDELLSFALDYPKGAVLTGLSHCTNWNPWTDDFDDLPAGGIELCYPQPILSDIEFDVYGNMMVAFNDRAGHQMGWYNYGTEQGNTALWKGNSGGDILRVYNNNGTWLIEKNGTAGLDDGCGADNGQGPCGGEFYCNDSFLSAHQEAVHGGIAIHPSFNELALDMMDATSAFSAGLAWYNNSTGVKNRAYRVYFSDNNGNTGLFGKAAGLGDLEMLCGEATIEIGNYVWLDDDKDGIQDACESPVENVNVTLYDKSGNEISSTQTDANGFWVFGTDNGLLPMTDYIVAFGTGQSSGGGISVDGETYVPTLQNTGQDTDGDPNTTDDKDKNDSDIAIADNSLPAIVQGLPVICLTTGELGQNNHCYDAGLITGFDYGDLPNTYATTEASNGPSHILKEGLFLGSCVDFEADGAPSMEAGTDGNGGDDQTAGAFTEGSCNNNDDEDGVALVTPMIPGSIACIEVTASSTNGTAVLNAWIDFNGDGDFAGDANENLVFTSIDGSGITATTDAPVANGTGTYIYCFDVPQTATFPNQETYMRFRLSMNGGLSYDGPADSGEVEDYYQPLAKIGNYVWEDLNANGLQDNDEPGLADIKVSISGTDIGGNNFMEMVTTGADGMYMFSGLLPNQEYCINFDLSTSSNAANLIFTPKDVPNNNNEPNDSDADPQTGDAGCYTPNPKEYIETVDAGIFSDKDGDKIPDMMDPDMNELDPQGYIYCENTGEIISGGLVQVTAGPGAVNVIEDGSSGFYQFTVAQPGVYTIAFTPPPGYLVSTSCTDQGLLDPNPGQSPFIVGSDDTDMDGFLDDATCGANPFYLQFNLEVGDLILANNLPLTCAELGDYVWEDTNLNGVQEAGEDGVEDIQVELYECNGGVKGNLLETTNTDNTGGYLFTGLQGNQEYCVEFDLANSTNPNASLFTITTQDQTNNGGDETNDSDANPADGCSDGVNLAPGEKYYDLDAGVYMLDYGDLPEGTGYATTSGNNGPSHSVPQNPILKLGATIDAELNGQPSANADGDGLDEDGITLPMFTTGTPVDIPVSVMNMTGEDAKLTMFIDWDNDGDFDRPEEMYSETVMDGDVLATFVGVTPPLYATLTVPVGVRLRISTDMAAVMSPNGFAPDGEVEDYLSPSMGFDYGDLNDTGIGTSGDPMSPMTPANYATTRADNGAQHKILTDATGTPILKIGAAVDDEADGQPSVDAGITGGDDNAIAPFTTDPDDEDGIDLNTVPLFILTQTTTLDIPVMNMTGVDATIAVFLDFNKDGSFDPANEKFTATVADGQTTVSVNVAVPVTAVVGQDLGLRVRLANDMAEVMTATGLAMTGEVEDYMVQIIGFDYGDLPDTYGTTDPDGPKHIVTEDLTLGNCVDSDMNGLPEPMAGLMAGGDDNDPGLATFGICNDGDDDEDGIEFVTPMVANTEACVEVTAVNNTGNPAVLQMWIDFNGNDVFDAGEEIFFTSANGNTIPVGGVVDELYCFDVPATATFDGGAAFVRTRLSPAGGLSANSQILPVPFGEIEDYKLPLAKLGNLVWEDSDFDGTQDAGEAGIQGVTVNLEWTNPLGGTVSYTTSTNASGNYYFCGLISGTYEVSVVDPADMTPSPADSGNDDFDDSDYATETVVIPNPIALPTGEDGLTDVPGGTDNFPDNQEDISIDFAFVGIDYGDLPNGFNTTNANNGAAHLMQDGKYLGSCVDAELDGAPDFDAGSTGNGDDGTVSAFTKGTCNGDDDEDGVRLLTPLVPGNTSCVEVTSTLPVGGGFLNAWIDYNGNDAFEAGEQVIFNGDGINGVLGAGTDVVTVLCFDVPANAVFEGLETHLRFRLSCDGNLGPDGLAADGEVEDYYQPLAKLGDFVWEDVNGNGIQDAGEPGLGGLTVTIDVLDANGNPYQATTTTDPTGMYMFFGLLPTVDVNGPYKLTFESPGADWVATGQDAPVNYNPAPTTPPGDDTNDSDMDETMFMVPNITLDPKENDPTIDAGFLLPAELGDLVWVDVEDINGILLEDGLQQINPELPVAGATLTLTGTDGLGRTVTQVLTSDANGNYLFEELWPGDYCVEFDVSTLTAPAALVPYAQFMVFTYQDAGDDTQDNDVDPGNYDSNVGKTTAYNLISQESELSVDGGILIPCIPPSNLTSSMIMLTTATLTWQVNNNPLLGTDVVEHCWNVEIGGAGFAVGNGQALLAFTVCEGDPGVTVNGDMVSYDVDGLIAGTCFDYYVSETCDGFFPGPNNLGWSLPHQFCTFDDPPPASFTAISPSCPENSPGFVPDGSFAVTVEDGTSCPGGTYDVTIISGPYTVAPPAYLGVPAGTYNFFNAGPGMYQAQINEVGICNPKPDLMPVIVDITVEDAIDNTPPTKFVTDVLGNEVPMDLGVISLPEGSCSYQMQLYVSGIDECDGLLTAPDAVSASAVTTPSSIDPGTQVNVIPDGLGQYLVDVNFSVGSTVLTINIQDVSGNTTTMEYTVEVEDNINPSVSITSNMNITIPACLDELEIPLQICIEDGCDESIDPAELVEDFGTATIVSGPTTTNGTCFDYVLAVSVDNDGDVFSVSYTDAFGNVGTASVTLTVEQAQEDMPPVIIAANENVTLEVCDPQKMVYSFQIFDDCAPINTADINFDDGGTGLEISFIDVQGNGVFVQTMGMVAPGTYFPVIEYQGVTVSPAISVEEQQDTAPVITMPGNLNFTIPVCGEELSTTISITISDDCDDPINEGNLSFSLCGEAMTPSYITTANDGSAYAEFEITLDAADDGCELIAIYTDGAGNTTTQVSNINVTQQADTWAPLVIYPSQSINVELEPCDEPLAQVCFEITATDNCDENVDIELAFDPGLADGAITILPSSGGDTYCIAAEPGSYTVTITAQDDAGNIRTEDFDINITQDPRPEVNLACNDNIIISLDEDCQKEIIPDMLLDGNEGCLEAEDFNIVIVDSDISNGPIADGCGEYIYEITLATPSPIEGFVEEFAAANWTVVEDNSGFFGPGDAEVTITSDEISLSTLAGNTASASIVMPSDGALSFAYDFNGVDVNFDFFIVDVANNEIENTSLSTNGTFTGDINAGDIVVFTVDDDGFDPFAGPVPSEASITDWVFTPSSDLDAGDFTTCWGYVTLEDKTAPVVECPDDTDQATLVEDVQVLEDDLLITDPTLDISQYPCFLGAANPESGTHYYDLYTFTVSTTDVYTFDMASEWGDGAMALYAGDFNPLSPCENIIAHSDDAFSGGPFFGGSLGININNFQPFDPIFRLSLSLQVGQTYTLFVSSWPADQTGDYAIAAYSDANGTLNGIPVSQETVMRDLICIDINEILIDSPAEYIVDADGNFVSIASDLNQILSYTGFPTVSDNCGDIKVTVSDQVEENGDCGEVVITRTFLVEDKQNSDCTGTPNTDVCTQQITIRKPTTQDVVLPPFTVYLECDEAYATDDNGNPHPSVSGYPWLQTAFGIADLAQSVCNLAATYSDEPGVTTCESGYEIRREWTVYDWCNPGDLVIYNQIIKVSDFTAPVIECPFVDYDWDGIGDLLTYSTGPFDCTASFEVPLPVVTDNCSSTEVFTQIVTDIEVDVYNQYGQVTGQTTETIVVTEIPWNTSRVVSGIPVGQHRIVYVVTDGCGNESTQECDFQVVDNVEPVAICDDALDITLGGQGYAQISAEDIDEGSYDNCGPVTIEVRRDETGPWGPFVEFSCDDVDQMVIIELRATDANGLSNICWMEVLIEDKVRPECVAPHNVDIACNEIPYDFDAFNTDQLQDLFGAADAADNCSATPEELTPIVQLHDCGFGRIIRRFRATDASGNVSTNACQQIVTIEEVHNYEIKFPRDAEANCGTPSPDTIEYNEIACDLLAVSVEDEFFSASDDECYKIFRTFRVINWCEYDGEGDPIVVGRDEDCDDNPGDEDVWVLVRSNEVTYYDRDNNEGNSNPFAFTKSPSCDGLTNPTGYWKDSNQDASIASIGYWQYTQVIKVYDNVEPTISFDPVDPFCSIDNENCDAEVQIPFSVDENCTPDDLTIKVFLDAFADGAIDEDLTNAGVLQGQYPNYTINGEYPLGNHAFEVHVEDGCGNVNSLEIPFSVVDCKAPTPVCINGLAIELMPVEDGTDADGDGDEDTGAMAIWAIDFIASPITDCSEPITYSINRSGETPVQSQSGIVLTCDDHLADNGTTFVEIYAWDSAFNPYAVQPDGTVGGPNYDFCETYILVQDNMFDLCGNGAGSIAGAIETEWSEAVEGVEVQVSGDMLNTAQTGADGLYDMTGLPSNGDYTVTPQLDQDHKNGVSTFDIVMIMRHILNVTPLESPYQMIAADVDKSNFISVSDLIAIRKLVLSVTDEFEANTSWRFVDAAYVFPEPTNPWYEEFPEVININDLDADQIINGDFIGVKIGDVNGDAQANGFHQIDDRFEGNFTIETQEVAMKVGQEYTISFTANLEQMAGYQATLQFDPQMIEVVDMLYENAKEPHFHMGYVDQGLITTSVDLNETIGEGLFQMVIRANANINLSEVLRISSRLTKAEAYNSSDERLDLALSFNGTTKKNPYVLYQNVPNPFQGQTMIGFELPQAMEAMIKVQDVSGRTLQIIRGDFAKGYNEVEISKEQLPQAGILYYTLETADYTATKKMIIIE